MGKRGPAPIPTEILQRRGSWRAGTNRDEPRPPVQPPECPSWLDADAKAAWEQIVPLLVTVRILARLDGNALTRYCQLWSRWKKAEEFIQKYGETYPLKDEHGQIKCFMPWPQVATAHRLASLLTRLEQEFGMTPSSRTRIRVGMSGDAAPLEVETEQQRLRRAFFAAGQTTVVPTPTFASQDVTVPPRSKRP